MRRLLLPLMGFALFCGGCAQIADRVLIPAQPADRAEWLAEQRRQVGRRLGDRLRAVDYKSPEDNTRLAALLMVPEKAPRGTVVVLHGLTDRKEAMLSVAESFAEAGYVAVVPDLRAHGSSGGRYTSLGYHEKRDMVALLDHLQSKGYDVSYTGVLGGSLGGAVSIQWAAIDPRIKAVVAVAPFAELRTAMQFFYKEHHVTPLQAFLLEASAQREGRFKINDVSPLAAIAKMNKPVLLAHGVNDDIVPVSESRRLFAAARGPVALQEVNGKHMDIKEVLGKAFMNRSIEWMDTYVSPTASVRCAPDWVAELPNRNMPASAFSAVP
jgi:uncharacterized protein